MRENRNNAELKQLIWGKAYDLGINLVRSCSASKWEELPIQAPEFGPRLRIVSILTDAPLPADAMLEKNLCVHCGKCLRSCPPHCFRERKGDVYEMDKVACTRYHVKIWDEHHWPCGVCANVCPVGEDLKAYRGQEMITREGILHCQRYGS